MAKSRKTRVIYQAGYTSHYGWHLCGYGLTMPEARENLKKLMLEKQDDCYGCGYLEQDFEEKWDEQNGVWL